MPVLNPDDIFFFFDSFWRDVKIFLRINIKIFSKYTLLFYGSVVLPGSLTVDSGIKF